MPSNRAIVAVILGLAGLSMAHGQPPAWKSLPLVKPEGKLSDIGGYTVADPTKTDWKPPEFK